MPTANQAYREMGVAWGKNIDIQKPRVERPYTVDELNLEGRWQAYPQSDIETPFNLFTVVNERFKLYEIKADFLPVHLSLDPQESPLPGHLFLDRTAKLARLRDLEQRLHEWHQNLPAGARIASDEGEAAAAPLVDLQ